jgi:hypothetical protein
MMLRCLHTRQTRGMDVAKGNGNAHAGKSDQFRSGRLAIVCTFFFYFIYIVSIYLFKMTAYNTTHGAF